MKRILFILAFLTATLCASAIQIASESPDSIYSRELDAVNIVAVKQETKLDREAVASTVLTRAEIEQLGARSIKGMSDVVPNLFMPDYGSRITSSIYLRGIGARMDHASVGLNVDNLPVISKDAYDFDIDDIESVDVLRGPQSTLFGRNTMAGVINITTLSPMRYQGWRIMAEGGNGNRFRISAGRYHKWNDRIAMSLAVSGFYQDGFFRNTHNNAKVDKERSGAVRWKTDWRITESIYLRNAFSVSILHQGGYPYEYVGSGLINYDDTCFYRRTLVSDGLTLSKRHDSFTVVSVTGLHHINDNMTLDQDFLPLPYFTLTQKKKEFSVSEDLVIKSNPSERKYHWLAGLFMFFKNTDMTAPVTFKDKGISALIEDNRNNANPYYPIRWDSRQFRLNSDFRLPSAGIALYHESKLQLSRFTFTAGLRIDLERAGLRYHSYCSTGYDIYHSPEDNGVFEWWRHVDIDINDRGNVHRTFLSWLPKISALYAFDDSRLNNIYLNVSKGTKSGGYNTQMFSDVLQQRLMGIMGLASKYDIEDVVGYDPEYSWNYEVGTHLKFFDNRLDLEATLFYIDCRNQQLTTFPDGTTTGRIMTNAGRTRSAGAELSARAAITTRLTANVSYGFTDAKFVRYYNGISDFGGKRIPYVPRNTAFGQILYTQPVRSKAVRSLLFDLNLRLTGNIMWNEENTLVQPLYGLFGASFTVEGQWWNIQIYGRNLTNTHYDTFRFRSMGNDFLQRGKPLEFGIIARFNF